MGRLNGKVAVITGGASGIGEGTVRLFAEEGAKVVIADIQHDLGHKLAAELGNDCSFMPTDISVSGDVQSLVAKTVSRFGQLDILFNNAGVVNDGYSIANYPEDLFDQTIAINLKGVFLGMKYAIPAMIAGGGGSIINNGAVAGLLGYNEQCAYGASKGAVVQLTRHAAIECGEANIRVNCLCTGSILTPLVFSRRPGIPEQQVVKNYANTNPLHRAGLPRDAAYAALWLASDESSFVTGQIIAVDGGKTASIYRGPTPSQKVW